MCNQRKWGAHSLSASACLELSEVGPAEVPPEVFWASCLEGGGICLADVQAGEVVPGVPELCAFIRNGHVVSVD